MPTFRSGTGCVQPTPCKRRCVPTSRAPRRHAPTHTPSQAQIYAAEGNDLQTYLLLYRHANLVLDHLQNHPEKNKPEYRKALTAATAAVADDLKKLEEIRPRIKRRYDEYQERRKAQLKALGSLEGSAAQLTHGMDGLSVNDKTAAPSRRSYEKQTLDAEGNQSLAAKLAQREVRRRNARDAARRSVRQAGVSEEEEQERRTGGVWGDWEKDLRRPRTESDNDLSSQLQEVARLQRNGHGTSNHSVRYHAEGN